MGKNILVLGGNGFLGTQILKSLKMIPNLNISSI